MSPHKFNTGDYVQVMDWQPMHGVVVSIFWTTACELRYVVENKRPHLIPFLHIAKEEDLRKSDLNES